MKPTRTLIIGVLVCVLLLCTAAFAYQSFSIRKSFIKKRDALVSLLQKAASVDANTGNPAVAEISSQLRSESRDVRLNSYQREAAVVFEPVGRAVENLQAALELSETDDTRNSEIAKWYSRKVEYGRQVKPKLLEIASKVAELEPR